MKGETEVKNLAGNKECDADIERELVRCGIEVVRDQPREGEVPSSLRGKLGDFTFRRAWYYWVVNGPVPLAVAQELYEDPVGRTDVRVNGDCVCPAPGEPGGDIVWRDRETKKILISQKDWEKIWDMAQRYEAELANKYQACDDPTTGEGFVESYHIDSEIGLWLFANTLKKHKLVQ